MLLNSLMFELESRRSCSVFQYLVVGQDKALFGILLISYIRLYFLLRISGFSGVSGLCGLIQRNYEWTRRGETFGRMTTLPPLFYRLSLSKFCTQRQQPSPISNNLNQISLSISPIPALEFTRKQKLTFWTSMALCRRSPWSTTHPRQAYKSSKQLLFQARLVLQKMGPRMRYPRLPRE